jgi:hypothetical protein
VILVKVTKLRALFTDWKIQGNEVLGVVDVLVPNPKRQASDARLPGLFPLQPVPQRKFHSVAGNLVN